MYINVPTRQSFFSRFVYVVGKFVRVVLLRANGAWDASTIYTNTIGILVVYENHSFGNVLFTYDHMSEPGCP